MKTERGTVLARDKRRNQESASTDFISTLISTFPHLKNEDVVFERGYKTCQKSQVYKWWRQDLTLGSPILEAALSSIKIKKDTLVVER